MRIDEKIVVASLKDVSLDKIYETIPLLLYCKDLDGQYICCNEQFVKYLGKSNKYDIIGKDDFDLFPKDIAELFTRNDALVLSKNEMITIEEINNISNKIPIFNKEKKIIGILNISITRHNLKQEQVLEQIMNDIPGHIYWKDTQGAFLGGNLQQALDMGLHSRHMLVGKTSYDTISKELPDKVKRERAAIIDKADQEIMKSGKPTVLEEHFLLPNGVQETYLSHKKPLFDEKGKVCGLLGISFDITERKNLEIELKKANRLAEAANELKTEFIENMQHDIRTPISGIFSLLDSVNRSGNISELKKYLPHLVNASRELLDIHNAVIDFESNAYGDKPVYERKFSLLELLHGIIHINSAATLAHESSLILEIDKNVPDVIKGDDYRLKKILLNLVGNAIKFTEKGKIILHVALLHLKNKKATIRFSVEDTGIGIPEDKLPMIFEKFTKLNPSNRGKFKGSGLGLHIVKKFVEELGAELDVKSVINEGTIFTIDAIFELPLTQQLAGETKHNEAERYIIIDATKTETSDANITADEKASISETTNASIRIGLIEDNVMALVAAENILKNINRSCHIEKAANVVDALNMLGEYTFDLVICDLGLPDGTGFDIIKHVKKNKQHKNYLTPFVALTAHSDDARRAQAKRSGFLGFYNKPLTEDMAKKILTEHLAAEVKLIDIAGMTDMFGGNEDTALEMIKTLVTSFKEERILFKDAFACNDYTKARQLFHKFRGGVSYIMSPILNKTALLLHDEVKAYEQEGKPLTDLMEQLHTLFKAVDDIEQWLNAYKA